MKDYPIPTGLSPEELQKRIDEERERCKQLTEWPDPETTYSLSGWPIPEDPYES